MKEKSPYSVMLAYDLRPAKSASVTEVHSLNVARIIEAEFSLIPLLLKLTSEADTQLLKI